MSAKDVGRRIHVYWVDEMAWFTGVVQAYEPKQGFYVLYDDGDERWERLSESYRFEGDNDTDAEEEDEPLTENVAASLSQTHSAPRATEPPASDEDESDEDDDDEVDQSAPATTSRSNTSPIYPLPVVLNDSADDTEDEHEQDDDDAQSVALTEVPATFEPVVMNQPQRSTKSLPHHRMVPHRGVLRGVVLHANDLPQANRRDVPRAYVRVALAEGAKAEESGRGGSLLLRCKQTLASTQPAPPSTDPSWNNDNDWQMHSGDGLFQLSVAPPCVMTSGVSTPAWHQLRGELIFSMYHQTGDDARGGEFLGQAAVTLARIMRDLLDREDETRPVTVALPLETRQGRPVGSPTAQLMVQCQCALEYPPEQRRLRVNEEPTRSPTRVAPSSSSTPRSATTTTAATNNNSKAKPARPSSSQAPAKPTSSSAINRRKQAKQIESENKAMAKRLEQTHRRQQPPYTKSEPKETVPIRHGHKASSQVNRSKFIDQVKRENVAMGKRLLSRVGGNSTSTTGRSAAKDTGTALDWDDAKAQDKAHVADKRRVLRSEKDHLMEKAQAAYQQQNELVEEVMALQQQVADAKAKLFQATAQIQRLDAMNKRDAHVRDCLQRAAAKSQRHNHNSNSGNDNNYYSLSDDDDQDEASEGTAVYRKELRELRDQSVMLESERQRLQDQLHAAHQREETLEDEILTCHRKWQFVQTKRAFTAKIASAPAAFAGHQLKKRQLELSPEEEEQYAIYVAQQELTQLQIALAVLEDKQQGGGGAGRPLPSSTSVSSSSSSSTKACEYLRTKIAKRKQQIEQREQQQTEWRAKYEALVVDGTYEQLRGRVQELQHLVFLCESEAKHVAAAERVASHRQQQTATALQRHRFNEQTESDVLFK